MTLYWNRMPHRALMRYSSLIALLCVLLSLAACVALDSSPTQIANNATSEKPSAKKSVQVNTAKPNKHKPKSALDGTNWNKHQNQTRLQNKKQNGVKKANMSELSKSFGVKNRMSLGTAPGSIPLNLASKKYSFSKNDTDIQLSLREFANKYKLDMYVDQDIDGDITVDFRNVSLKKAMALMLGRHDYYWAWKDGLIRVSRLQTKVFIIDYLRLTRTGQATNNSTISRTNNIEINERSSSSIQQNDNLAFWEELETQLTSLISDQGRFVVNRLSGTIQVTDIPIRIKETESFIASLQQALHRQVEIDARILEVTLRDDQALGIDWNAISIKGITGTLTNAITDNNQGLNLKTSTLSLGYNHDKFSALISALDEQGFVNVVSQPRIRIINNQPALIKVGSDRTFFTQTVNRTIANTGIREVYITDEPYSITEGLVLSVTPQISKDRWIMLDIAPVITRITEIVTSAQGSTAPVLDIKQASTLIRARDGEMIILGGLIQESTSNTDRQVPFFAQLPIVGKLFEGNYSTNSKKELIIFLVPRLVL